MPSKRVLYTQEDSQAQTSELVLNKILWKPGEQ